MFKQPLLAMGVLFAATSLCLAQQASQNKPEVNNEPIKQTSAASGKQMFVQYCAPCHGADGTGSGPAAAVMKDAPSDLTQLAKTHNGKYRADMVAATLKFGSGPASHGSAGMPVWGPLFRSLDKYHDSTAQQRISNLVSYLQTLQAK